MYNFQFEKNLLKFKIHFHPSYIFKLKKDKILIFFFFLIY